MRQAAEGFELVRDAGEATRQSKRRRLMDMAMGLHSGLHVQMLSKPAVPDSGEESEAMPLTTQSDTDEHLTSLYVELSTASLRSPLPDCRDSSSRSRP